MKTILLSTNSFSCNSPASLAGSDRRKYGQIFLFFKELPAPFNLHRRTRATERIASWKMVYEQIESDLEDITSRDLQSILG